MKKKNKKYSIPIYENGIETKHTIDGTIGDEEYSKLLKYGNGLLPNMINIIIKKKHEKNNFSYTLG